MAFSVAGMCLYVHATCNFPIVQLSFYLPIVQLFMAAYME